MAEIVYPILYIVGYLIVGYFVNVFLIMFASKVNFVESVKLLNAEEDMSVLVLWPLIVILYFIVLIADKLDEHINVHK